MAIAWSIGCRRFTNQRCLPHARSNQMAKVETPTVDALSRAHTSLQKDLRELEEAGHTASEKGLPGLRSRLKSTRKHIAEHFRFEEQGGYMDAVRKREPRLGRVIDELC